MMNSILIDTHAHVWDRSCALVPGARYRPDYEATIDTYLGVLDAHGIERAVLVQPSFLGTDNRYLLDCLRAYPDRLRGIVVISEDATSEEIEDMRSVGVIGMRFNLIGRDASVMKSKPAGELVDRVVQQNWFVEVHVDGEYLSDVLTVLKSHRSKVIVDHFGRP
ncbi:MAG: amidohydrolase family protein, partial [Pseudomonadota bacterium]